MDIGTVSALALASYQAAVSSYGQGSIATSPGTGSSAATSSSGTSSPSGTQDAAALQALASVYTNLTTNSNSILPVPDTLSALAGNSGALGSLVSGIYQLSAANGNSKPDLSALSATAATVGGLNATTASILFAGNSSNGQDGFSALAVNMNSILALASYSDHLNNIPTGSLGAAATAAAASIDPNQPSAVQNAIQAAQSSALTSSLNLFA